jgi:hypothetical protein
MTTPGATAGTATDPPVVKPSAQDVELATLEVGAHTLDEASSAPNSESAELATHSDTLIMDAAVTSDSGTGSRDVGIGTADGSAAESHEERDMQAVDPVSLVTEEGDAPVPRDHIEPSNFINIKPSPPSRVFTYLGGALNIDLNWGAINKVVHTRVMAGLANLRSKRVTLGEAIKYAEAVLQGRAAYTIQMSKVPLYLLAKWDATLNKILRAKAGATGSSHGFHAAVSDGGLGVFTHLGLAQCSGGTELMIRLNDDGLPGAMAKHRLQASLAFLGRPPLALSMLDRPSSSYLPPHHHSL